MDYKSKYIKYKEKYINLANELNNSHIYNIMQGGSKKKVFDLSQKYPEYKKGELHKNLEKFIKEFGMDFQIKYKEKDKEYLLDIIIEETKIPSGVKFYRMIYDIPHRTTHLTPFIIDFIDHIKLEKNNITYISNIQKTKEISGSTMVKICLEINRILGVEKTLLGDGTRIFCEKTKEELDLSFIKLIERGTTFYMNLGFDFEMSSAESIFFYWRISSKEELEKRVKSLIENIRSIKTQDLIKEYKNILDLIIEIIKDNYKQKLEILKDNSNPSKQSEIYSENPKEKLSDIFTECKEVLDILNKYSDEQYFYKILVKLFKDSCEEYSKLLKYIVENQRTNIIYGDTEIKREYFINFKYLTDYRSWYWYSYTF